MEINWEVNKNHHDIINNWIDNHDLFKNAPDNKRLRVKKSFIEFYCFIIERNGCFVKRDADYRIKWKGKVLQQTFLREELEKMGIFKTDRSYLSKATIEKYGYDKEPYCKKINILDDSTDIFEPWKSHTIMVKRNIKKVINEPIDKDELLKKADGLEDWKKESIRKIIDTTYKVSIDNDKLENMIKQKAPYKNWTIKDRGDLRIKAFKLTTNRYDFTICEKTNRLYNGITYINKELRSLIEIDKQPTKEIDLSNAQPLLLSTIVNIPRFKEACEKGIFYEELAQAFNITREEAKDKVKPILFSKITPKTTKDYEVFEGLYPGLLDEVRKSKSKEPLWKTLQSLESESMVYRFGKLNIVSDFLTIHDAIIVKESELDKAIEGLNIVFNELGIKEPPFKIS